MKHAHLLLILAVLCTTACKKDEIDLSSLTSNPFDAEYNGDPIFAMVDQETVEQTISGVVQQRLNVTVSVRSDLFRSQPPTRYVRCAGAQRRSSS